MGTKMKGVLKRLRYITQIFEDEKEPEMQIGFPTDVKHVAHIGWDGQSPSVDNSPSWMKEYKSSEGHQTENDKGKDNLNLRCGSQDSSCQRGSEPQTNPSRDLPDLPKSSRRQSLFSDPSTSSPKVSKSRKSRRNSSDSSKSTRKQKDSSPGSESPSRILLGLPKKFSRKKTKEKESAMGGSSKSQKKNAPPSNLCYDSNKLIHSSSWGPSVKEEEDKG